MSGASGGYDWDVPSLSVNERGYGTIVGYDMFENEVIITVQKGNNSFADYMESSNSLMWTFDAKRQAAKSAISLDQAQLNSLSSQNAISQMGASVGAAIDKLHSLRNATETFADKLAATGIASQNWFEGVRPLPETGPVVVNPLPKTGTAGRYARRQEQLLAAKENLNIGVFTETAVDFTHGASGELKILGESLDIGGNWEASGGTFKFIEQGEVVYEGLYVQHRGSVGFGKSHSFLSQGGFIIHDVDSMKDLGGFSQSGIVSGGAYGVTASVEVGMTRTGKLITGGSMGIGTSGASLDLGVNYTMLYVKETIRPENMSYNAYRAQSRYAAKHHKPFNLAYEPGEYQYISYDENRHNK